MWWYLLWSQYLCSPKTHVEILMRNVVLVLGVEVFGGRWLGHDECLYKRGPGDLPTPFYHIRIQVDVWLGTGPFPDHAAILILDFQPP